MASLDELGTALRNADFAGDTNAARILAAEIAKMQSASSQQMTEEDHRSAFEKLIGQNGPRYQTWPERAVRGLVGAATDAAKLPGQYVQEATTPRTSVSDSDVSVLSVPRAANFAAMANPIPAALRAGEGAPLMGMKLAPEKPPIPTAQELKAAGGADIQAAKNSGLELTASSLGDWSRKMQQDLFEAGVHPVDAPSTYAKLKELENAPPGAIATAANLQSLRESLGHTAQNFNPNAGKDQLAASRSIRGLDSLLPGQAEEGVLAGTPAATQALFERGRGNYAAAMRSNDLTGVLDRARTGILERAEGRAQASYSGRNIDNTIRQKAEAILEKPKEISGLSDEQLAALENVTEGGPVRNTARYIGNLLGGGGGLGQTGIALTGMSVGGAMGGPQGAAVGLIPAAVGAGAKGLANILAKRSLTKADEAMRMDSPLYKETLQAAPVVPANLTRGAAVARMLLMEALANRQQ